MRRYRHYRSFTPEDPAGFLYYARIKSNLGIFYKIGFTSLGSVGERLAFQGKGDDALVDKVLIFVHMNDAFNVEQQLHSHFSSSRAFKIFSVEPDMPLCKNGQSELYYKDVLDRDEDYTLEQSKQTHKNVKLQYARRTRSDEAAHRHVAMGVAADILSKAIAYALMPVLLPLIWLIGKLWRWATDTKDIKHVNTSEKKLAHLNWQIARAEEEEAERSDAARHERQMKILRLQELTRGLTQRESA